MTKTFYEAMAVSLHCRWHAKSAYMVLCNYNGRCYAASWGVSMVYGSNGVYGGVGLF